MGPDGLDARLLSFRLLPRLSWEKCTRAVGASAGFADALTVQAELTAADGRVCDAFLTAGRLGPERGAYSPAYAVTQGGGGRQ